MPNPKTPRRKRVFCYALVRARGTCEHVFPTQASRDKALAKARINPLCDDVLDFKPYSRFEDASERVPFKRTKGELLAAAPAPQYVYILSWQDPRFATRSNVATRSPHTANDCALDMITRGKEGVAIERLRDPFPRATPRELPSR
jgi:hypothetical protein